MPRRLRCNTGGYAYHVLNRAVDRAALFPKDGDYAAFEAALRQAKEWRPVRLLAYTLMPNHWRLVLWPKRDGEVTSFLRWLTTGRTTTADVKRVLAYNLLIPPSAAAEDPP